MRVMHSRRHTGSSVIGGGGIVPVRNDSAVRVHEAELGISLLS